MKSTKNKPLFCKKDVNKWYSEVIKKSEIFLHGDVKGFFYFDWYGLKIWERIKIILSDIFEENHIKEIKVPLFFEKSDLEREKNHFSGFFLESFELTYQHHDLIVRPTSEILFLKYFKKKLFSYRDLPFSAGQWGNVFRKEKNNKAFLRTNEFFWYEGHGVFQNFEEMSKSNLFFISLLASFFKNILCLPFISGIKTENEKFFGANETFTFEVLLPDNQWLQSATVHNLGTNFSKNFSLKLSDQNNKLFFPHTNSFGISTRIIGALVMSHGDDNGLVLPSQIAPFQVCFIVYWKFLDQKKINIFLNQWKYQFKQIFHIRFIFNEKKLDPFWFLKDCIIKGVCLFFEVGKLEIENNYLSFFTRTNFEKKNISFSSLTKQFFFDQLAILTEDICKKNNNFLNLSLKEVRSEAELLESLKEKKTFYLFVNWKTLSKDDLFEKQINLHQLSIRVIKHTNLKKICFLTGTYATHMIYIGRSY